MAPEQIRGESVDARTDVYALGCVLYQALTGQAPYRGTDVAVMLSHLDYPFSALEDSSLSPFQPVIERALSKEPAERYPTAGDLARGAEGLTLVEPAPLDEDPTRAVGSAISESVRVAKAHPRAQGGDHPGRSRRAGQYRGAGVG